jgi:hypothetical protein
MTTDPADLREQVADGLFTINALRTSGLIDTTKVGVIGYSWGGPAAFLLADNPLVAAGLSLDGSEMHYYGTSDGEDSNFDRLRPSLLRSAGSRFAYAYLESDGKQNEHPADSIFDILPAFKGTKKYLRFPGAAHEDFSCLPSMAAMIRKSAAVSLPDYPDFALKWFARYLKDGPDRLPRDSPYPVVNHSTGSVSLITARVLDAEDRTPLAYVNVGIPGKNLGTVTHEDGSFKLQVNTGLATDSLAVSMAGYEKHMIPLKKIPAIILLHRRSGGLTEAVVTSAIRPVRIYGNKTTSNLVSVGFPTRFSSEHFPDGTRQSREHSPAQCTVMDTKRSGRLHG